MEPLLAARRTPRAETDACIPFCLADVVRTRVQVEGVGVVETCRTLLREEGARGFLRGITARMLLLVPNGAIMMTAYELVKRLSRKDSVILHEEGEDVR